MNAQAMAVERAQVRFQVAKDRRKRLKVLTKEQDASLMKMCGYFMEDELLHACVIVDGPIQFTNTWRKMLKGLIQRTRVEVMRGEIGDSGLRLVNIYENMLRDVVIACAWNIVTGVGWQRTLDKVSQTLEPGVTLPPNTTAQMVLDHLDFNSPDAPEDPEEKQVEITSHMSEAEHEQAWHGSSRVKKGTVREILQESKLSGMKAVGTDGDRVTMEKV